VHFLSVFFQRIADEATRNHLHFHHRVGGILAFIHLRSPNKVTQVMDFARRHHIRCSAHSPKD